MRHPLVADRKESLLLVVDVQEAMSKAVPVWESSLTRISQLIRAAAALQIPMLVTEHYRKGLGGTFPEIAALMEGAPFFQKEHFSACEENGFLETVRSFHRRQIILTGMETHVCVLQTGLDLLQAGYQVHVPENAVASRYKEDWRTAVNLFRSSGAVITTAEIVIFQWVHRANTDEFRRILPVVK